MTIKIKKMKKIYLFVLLSISGHVHGQSISPSIVNSMGGTATINGNIYDWSFGEMTLIHTVSTSNLIVTQGVLQPATDTAVIGINSLTASLQNIQIYQNPATDMLYLESDQKEGKLQYVLMDISGKIIVNKESGISGGKKKETIDLTRFPAGIYLLQVTVHEKKESLTRTYKVQKLN